MEESKVGKQGGKQNVNINSSVGSSGIVIHEILHAAGFIHEQSRSDRDDFVTIISNNIVSGKEHNFDKDIFSENRTSYDFNSIMHYDSNSFGKVVNGVKLNTIVPVNPNKRIFQGSNLSNRDIVGINAVYKTILSVGGTNGGGTPDIRDPQCGIAQKYCSTLKRCIKTESRPQCPEYSCGQGYTCVNGICVNNTSNGGSGVSGGGGSTNPPAQHDCGPGECWCAKEHRCINKGLWSQSKCINMEQ